MEHLLNDTCAREQFSASSCRLKAAYFTLGCKLNFAETSTIGQQLKDAGIMTAQDGEVADVCIVNTCSVTEVADHKCRQAISKLVRNHPGSLVVVTGCYAQLKPEQVAGIKGVDLVLGAEEKGEVVPRILRMLAERTSMNDQRKHDPSTLNPRPSTLNPQPSTLDPQSSPLNAFTHKTSQIRSFMPSCSCGNRTRYFLKVQDGCDYYCTYCTIPIARGRSRNGSIASLVAQAEEVAKKGGKEIVITGVNIGDFGKTTGETFFDLVKALDAVEGIERYRISSIEPNLLTDEIIEYCAQSRAFMPHFHVPLQSGSDEVLSLMHRRYDTALFRHKMEKIHELMPDAFIGVDVIVGTRGETPEFFADAQRFIESLDISQLHVFSYSERPGTKALNIPYVVAEQDKHSRSNALLSISDQKLRQFYEKYRGTTRPVLLEHSKTPGVMHGFTDNYIKVELQTPQPTKGGDGMVEDVCAQLDNTIVMVRLGDWNEKQDALTSIIVE